MLHSVSLLTEQLRAAVARYERDDNLGALFDAIRAMALDAGTDALIAAAEDYHDRPEVVIPVYEHVTSERPDDARALVVRSEEHTSELQSQSNLVCRLLLEKK